MADVEKRAENENMVTNRRYNESKAEYDRLFYPPEKKIEAFDQIAERFYMANFGEMQKVDFETLLFSLYLERILDESQESMNTYSDYELSKHLGLTQSKINTLKIRKELKYPYYKFHWKEAFKRILGNAVYENGKIRLNIQDPNLYLEVKNAIESCGGYVAKSQPVLQVLPEFFVDLMMVVEEVEPKEREKICEIVQQYLKSRNLDGSRELKAGAFGNWATKIGLHLGKEVVDLLLETCIGIGTQQLLK